MRLGFIGLGQMGAAIAANLVGTGHELRVWNRSPDKAAALVAGGATLAKSPRDAATGAEVVLTMLADDAALSAVLDGDEGLYAGLAPGALHISLSTIAVATADCVAAGHGSRNQAFLSAPVFGRPAAAAAAKLFIVAGGDEASYRRALPLFAQIGQASFHAGATSSSANLIKLCGNFMILATIEMLAEAMTLAAKGGVGKEKFLEVMTGTLFGSPLVRTYGAILAAGEYRPAGFAAPLGLKDMRLVAQAAEGERVPMPFLNVLRDHLLQTIATEGGDVDWSAIALSVARNSGLER
jgi:3-hydroxyisobutyrate dehydrogenase-like beta-hydroxyacid dehydrogenase